MNQIRAHLSAIMAASGDVGNDMPWARLRGEEQSLFGWRSGPASRVATIVKWCTVPKRTAVNDWSRLRYILWPALMDRGDLLVFPIDSPAFRLRLILDNGTEDEWLELIKALRWWANFGGIGGRTRRGMGAVSVWLNETNSIMDNISAEDAHDVGCTLKIKSSFSDPCQALIYGVNRLYNFLQGKAARDIGSRWDDIKGRDVPEPHRSLWPEPDAIRRLARHHSEGHQPGHPAGNLYPRAMFGLPKEFRFKGGVDDYGKQRSTQRILCNDGDSTQLMKWDPTTTQLIPKKKERLASPLILRPRAIAPDSYECIVLRLPESIAQLDGLSLTLRETRPSHENYPLFDPVEISRCWDPVQAANVPPIDNTGEQDPLSAFLVYFNRQP